MSKQDELFNIDLEKGVYIKFEEDDELLNINKKKKKKSKIKSIKKAIIFFFRELLRMPTSII